MRRNPAHPIARLALALSLAACVKQVTPLGPSRLVVNEGGSDQVVRNDSGAVTRDTSLRFRIEPLPSLATDGFQLPLPSADGMQLAWQRQSNFNWPMLTAAPEAPPAVHGIVSVRGIEESEAAHTWEGPYMLGRGCDARGVLVESPQEDGSRWIGLLPWDGGDPRWLVQDSAVNAFASLGPRGELAWSRRAIGEREFTVIVERPEGRFEWPRKPEESWMLPIVAPDGIFAMRLRDGTLELAYLPLRPGQTMKTEESRPAIIRRSLSMRGSERLAYQCFSSIPPDRAVRADGSLMFFHPDLGRMAIWQPRTDTLTPLPLGTLSATSNGDKQLLVSFKDRLATLSLPVDPVRGPVTVIQEPWLARSPSGPGSNPGRVILLLPGAGTCRIAALRLD
ncbi:MAG: hypothetical protein K8R92_05730 [Planctomycetes bacterium]|nr:hypothetical protein [Planctomycetota bacterium]